MVGRTPSVLLVGHSFVRRLKDHASKRGQTLAEAVGIEEVASVHTIYAGGATFERALHPSTSLVVRLRDLKELPEIMCIDLGTNDLCAVGATVNAVVARTFRFFTQSTPHAETPSVHGCGAAHRHRLSPWRLRKDLQPPSKSI